jgi:hypothetical protein
VACDMHGPYRDDVHSKKFMSIPAKAFVCTYSAILPTSVFIFVLQTLN